MSKKSSRSVPKQPTPRSMDEIRKAYNTLLAQAGEAQYQVAIYSKAADSLNKELEKLNAEGAIRIDLDRQAAAALKANVEEMKAEQAAKAVGDSNV